MPKRSTDLRKISSFQFGANICINSADAFRKKLEREYFAEVNIGDVNESGQTSNLVVEFQSNFSLVEFLHQIQEKNIGKINRTNKEDFHDLSVSEALDLFRAQNAQVIDLEEINLLFNDCEITIKKIYPNSIEDQLGNIYYMLAKHYEYYSYNGRRLPSEIFIPVFEENLEKNFKPESYIEESASSKRDYFNFWGIYFSHNDGAVIYDLNKRSIISGDLYTLG
ncbi:MAG: hypothetical protein KJO04_03990 [Bacteroidia bacterium]|nr:hypothetical protein [Bacteroidia bacterium]